MHRCLYIPHKIMHELHSELEIQMYNYTLPGIYGTHMHCLNLIYIYIAIALLNVSVAVGQKFYPQRKIYSVHLLAGVAWEMVGVMR